MTDIIPLDKKAIAESFSRYASDYADYAFIQQEIGQRLLQRATFLNQAPTTILDLGAGPGIMFKTLRKAFPKAHIVGLDIAWGMCERTTGFWQSRQHKAKMIQADMEVLPFKDNSFDLVFSNCAFQWSTSLKNLFSEVNRVIKPEGALFFSSFGPDTLKELKSLWQTVDRHVHVHPFLDLHDYGDMMLKNGLSQPVVGSEHLTVTYKKLNQHLKDLKYTGARNLSPVRKKGLTSPNTLTKLNQAFEKAKGTDHLFRSTYEVIYGHAIKTAHRFTGVKPMPVRLIR